MTNNAASNGFSLSFTLSSGSIAAVTLTHENSGSSVDENTLLHGEPILIVSTSNLENVTLEFVAELISRDFSSHSLTEETEKFLIVIDNDGLLLTCGRISNV